MVYAAPGYVACGASAKVDGFTNDIDDVGMIGLRIIFCNRHNTTINYYQTIYDDYDKHFPAAVWTNFY